MVYVRKDRKDGAMLHIDPWQIHQSMISGTGCSSCVKKMITGKQAMHGCKQFTWVDIQKNGRHYEIIYMDTQVRTVSHAVTDLQSITPSRADIQSRRVASECPSRPRSRKSANCNPGYGSTTWQRRKGQYSSPPSVFVSLSLSLCHS